MLYLGIDQHARQLTISLRDEAGDVLQARQVSTRPEKCHEYFTKFTRERLRDGESFIAVLEVCGFNDWLIRLLQDYRCQKVILIHPEERKKRKTDRRDAVALSELLWVNRDRFLAGKPVRGLRQADIASQSDQENRRLTALRKEASQARTRIVNKPGSTLIGNLEIAGFVGEYRHLNRVERSSKNGSTTIVPAAYSLPCTT